MSMIDAFLSNVTVLDLETNSLIPDQAEIVEIAAAHWHSNDWKVDGTLLGSKNGIPPAASARNNISNRMIQGLPTFVDNIEQVRSILKWPDTKWYVAHNVQFDSAILSTAWKNAKDTSSAELSTDKSRWICTCRLAKHLLADDYPDCEYNLNYLRYLLDLPIDDDIKLHRATDDAYLCSTLLLYLIAIAVDKNMIDVNDDIGEQLNHLCWSTIIQKTYPFGKYRGVLLTEIPNEYYLWSFSNMPSLIETAPEYDADLAESIRQVLEARLLST